MPSGQQLVRLLLLYFWGGRVGGREGGREGGPRGSGRASVPPPFGRCPSPCCPGPNRIPPCHAHTLSIPHAAFSSPPNQMYFTVLLSSGAALLALAFLVFLPLIILAPAKFALSFTLGCGCIMAGFAVLQGWQQQVQVTARGGSGG